MRNKIIAVNAVIVLIVGILSFVLMRSSILAASNNMDQLLADAKRDAQGATARMQLDGLRVERWLAAKASAPSMLEPLSKASPSARGDAATSVCDAVLGEARNEPAFEGRQPSMALYVDQTGRILGRNGSNLSRGDDIASVYPSLELALKKGQSGSDIWANKDRGDLYLASFSPIRDEGSRVVGALVVGRNLNDIISKASDATTGRGLLLVVPMADTWQVIARSSQSSPSLVEALSGKAKEAIRQTFEGGYANATDVGNVIAASAPLEGLGNGKRAVLVAEAPASRLANAAALPNPILGVTVLGLLLVIAGGWLLGNYIDVPVAMLEEGLLAILNGQSDKRFELEHAELGGLAFRIDQLLNQLMGVEEDTTDAEGRPSKAPSAADYRDAMSVDGTRSEEALDVATVQRLAAEPEKNYYERIYGEYIAAKKALGEETSHITLDAFVGRIQGMERDAGAKHGRPVRYHVKATGREVVLIAVPLP